MSELDSSGVDEVLDQHQTLLGLMTELESQPGLDKELRLLTQLDAMLAEHFELEECHGGFFDQVLEDAQLAQVTVQRLIAEHKQLREATARAVMHMRACLDGPVKAARDEVSGIIAQLRKHEKDEAGLLADSLYQEIGGEG